MYLADTDTIMQLRDVASLVERLADAAEVDLPAACVFSNASPDLLPALDRAYAARSAHPNAIDFVRLPAATLRGDNFHMTVGGARVEEQIVPHQRDAAERGPALPKQEQIGDSAVLIARYGVGTWGHWIGELLPKAVMVERRYPGRFRYLMPARIVAQRDPVAVRVTEAFAAYGIEVDRFVPLAPDTEYRCTDLMAITPTWSDRVPHPAATTALRALPERDYHRYRVALLRSDDRRAITNMDAVHNLLAGAGFYAVEIGTLAFAEQVAVLRSAETIFSTLGSTLSGLIYAPAGVRVVVAVPESFLDGFFYTMVQERRGTYAEVRGPLFSHDAQHVRDNAFRVPLGDLRRAFAATGLTLN